MYGYLVSYLHARGYHFDEWQYRAQSPSVCVPIALVGISKFVIRVRTYEQTGSRSTGGRRCPEQ